MKRNHLHNTMSPTHARRLNKTENVNWAAKSAGQRSVHYYCGPQTMTARVLQVLMPRPKYCAPPTAFIGPNDDKKIFYCSSQITLAFEASTAANEPNLTAISCKTKA